jgi:hypothetical protein
MGLKADLDAVERIKKKKQVPPEIEPLSSST